MSEEELTAVPDGSPPSPPKKHPLPKSFFREKVWYNLEKKNFSTSPHPIFGRIPSFKGADKAAGLLSEMEEFKAARNIEVNPDKALESVRALVMEADKVLYVPMPQSNKSFLKKLCFCEEDKPQNAKLSVSRWGLELLGKEVHFDENFHIDLIVLGSVAVSKAGQRIGKGKGYADLEYAILKELKIVSDATIIVTIVHQSQVFDYIPPELFEKHDLPMDYIITPTEVIKIEKKLQRPEKIYWNMITQKNLQEMSVLLKLKELDASKGIDTTVKDINVELLTPSNDPKPLSKRQTKQMQRLKPHEHYLYKTRYQVPKGIADSMYNAALTPKKKKNAIKALKRRTGQRVDYSLLVSNIHKDVRLGQLKAVLTDNGIRPTNITWRGYKGFCYLHYARTVKKEDDQEVEEKPLAADFVIEILSKLKLSPDSTPDLDVKVMEPTRIETTTDVTAV